MCIAIMKSENKKISKSTLQRCYDANPDGAGFMFADNKELTVKKGYFTFKEFYKEYKKINWIDDSNVGARSIDKQKFIRGINKVLEKF